MSAVVLTERPPRLWDDEPRRPSAPAVPERVSERDGDVGNGPTLADVLASAWEGLSARVTVACPICHGELDPQPRGGGRCRSCGTTLT
jgi:hypothetical protein